MDETKPKTVTTAKGHAANKKSLESLVGKTIKLKLTSDEQVEGAIYTYDKITNCIALDCSQGTSATRRMGSYRIIKISYIKEIVSVSSEKKQLNEPSYLPVDRLRVREREAIDRLENKISKMGVGVTQEAQDIFNGLSKTLPCRWAKDTIVVMDEILIVPPYRVEDCKANSTSSASLARVKKVLEGERRKLEK
ncbi:hypothetical protein K501DRAFT_214514 [Backusella circina FSU 941]|nr:hypothetical protein K501DRAFT_214514 [Backusella circina FSU 941]